MEYLKWKPELIESLPDEKRDLLSFGGAFYTHASLMNTPPDMRENLVVSYPPQEKSICGALSISAERT